MTEALTLYVGWQNKESRAWFVVGRLRRVPVDQGPPEYEFGYVRGVEKAQSHGFQPFVAFPDLDSMVRSNTLLPFFSDRLMPKSRPDYRRYLEQLDLNPLDPHLDDFAILARSGGLRTTEHGEVELFAPPHPREDGTYGTFFWVRGMKYVDPDRKVRISQHEPLSWMREVQNEYNPKAVLLRTKDDQAVGYVPDYLCDDLSVCLDTLGQVSITAVKVDSSPLVPPRNRVLCYLTAQLPTGMRPFSTDQFKPRVCKDLSRAA